MTGPAHSAGSCCAHRGSRLVDAGSRCRLQVLPCAPAVALSTRPCTRPMHPQLLPDLLAARPTTAHRRRRSDSGGGGSGGSGTVTLATAVGAALATKQEFDGAAAPELLHVQGIIACARGRQSEGLSLLERAAAKMLHVVEDLQLGLDLYAALEPAKVLGVVRRLVTAAGPDPRQPGEPPVPALGRAIRCASWPAARLASSHRLAPARREAAGGNWEDGAQSCLRVICLWRWQRPSIVTLLFGTLTALAGCSRHWADTQVRCQLRSYCTRVPSSSTAASTPLRARSRTCYVGARGTQPLTCWPSPSTCSRWGRTGRAR